MPIDETRRTCSTPAAMAALRGGDGRVQAWTSTAGGLRIPPELIVAPNPVDIFGEFSFGEAPGTIGKFDRVGGGQDDQALGPGHGDVQGRGLPDVADEYPLRHKGGGLVEERMQKEAAGEGAREVGTDNQSPSTEGYGGGTYPRSQL